MRHAMLALISAFGIAAPASAAGPEPAEPMAAKDHVAIAARLAGDRFAPIANGFLCRSPAAGSSFVKSFYVDKSAISGKAFDGLYYVGTKFVGAWIIQTNDGLIMIDAMNNSADAEGIVEAGMRGLGLDPSKVKVLIISHGHFDHFGGAKYFQDKYGTRVYMTAADWDFAYDFDFQKKSGWPHVEPPRRDVVIRDGDVLDQGGASIRFVTTPGHTPGTVSLILDLKYRGKHRIVALLGGTAIPTTSKGLAEFHDSFHKFWLAAREAGAESSISTHPFVDDTLGRFERSRRGERDPFYLGKEGFERFMSVEDECISAQASRFDSWGW